MNFSSTSSLSTKEVTVLGGVTSAWFFLSAMYTHQYSCLSSVK